MSRRWPGRFAVHRLKKMKVCFQKDQIKSEQFFWYPAAPRKPKNPKRHMLSRPPPALGVFPTPDHKMAVNLALAADAEFTPRGGGASAGDVSGSLSKGGKAGNGQSRAKAAQQRERTGLLSKPVVRRHVMKDLTKVKLERMLSVAAIHVWW